jgi:hypothetical protein
LIEWILPAARTTFIRSFQSLKWDLNAFSTVTFSGFFPVTAITGLPNARASLLKLMRLKPPKEIPDSITTSNLKFLSIDVRTDLASVPSTSILPTLIVWILRPLKRIATSMVCCPDRICGANAPSSTPTTLSLGTVLL